MCILDHDSTKLTEETFTYITGNLIKAWVLDDTKELWVEWLYGFKE